MKRWLVVASLTVSAFAGGPRYVTGVSGFPAAQPGTPIVWANGSVAYYTDQGPLSSQLDQAGANAFVADAFSRWTSVSTAALTATRLGALDEDVSGTNVTSSDGNITIPTDIQPNSNKPVGIVYDADGTVTEVLVGTGASDPSLCRANAVTSTVDKFTLDGHLAHALLIINGRCAQTADQLPELKYHLIRQIGRVLGLDWSQTNQGVATATLTEDTLEHKLGFPLMHPTGPFCSASQSISECLPNSDQLRMDDRAAISRLYPVTAENIGSFPGKQLLSSRIRIRGRILFRLPNGAAGQGMHGVNIQARALVANIEKPEFAASSVSGFLFRGNAGNSVTGFTAISAQRYDAFGSAEAELEGFYDLAGLELPSAENQVSYRLTFSAPLFTGAYSVGPYREGLVTPFAIPQVVDIGPLSAGDDVVHDIIIDVPLPPRDLYEPNSFRAPARLPLSGDWSGTISGYGDEDFFTLDVKAGRTISIAATAMANTPGAGPFASEYSLQPVIGIWSSNAAPGTSPLVYADKFNGASTGRTELNATINNAGKIKIGVADYRGDGRPDFAYRAHLLYADEISPKRIALAGTPLTITGVGFRRGMTVRIGGSLANVLSVNANRIVVASPAIVGTAHVTVTDPETGASSTIFQALQVGAAAGDSIQLLTTNQQVIVPGSVTPQPLRFRVVTAAGDPVEGASVLLGVTPTSAALLDCPGQTTTCTLISNGGGEVSSRISITSAQTYTIRASLASNPNAFVTSAVQGSGVGLKVQAQGNVFLLQGTTLVVPLSARVLQDGVPVSNAPVTFSRTVNSLTVKQSTFTNASGDASVGISVSDLQTSVAVTACYNNSTPCAPPINVIPRPVSQIQLEVLDGSNQTLHVGAMPAPLVLRAGDTGNFIQSMPVTFVTIVLPPRNSSECDPRTGICEPVTQRVISSASTTLTTSTSGIVSLTPQLQSSWGPVRVLINAYVGSTKLYSTEWSVVR